MESQQNIFLSFPFSFFFVIFFFYGPSALYVYIANTSEYRSSPVSPLLLYQARSKFPQLRHIEVRYALALELQGTRDPSTAPRFFFTHVHPFMAHVASHMSHDPLPQCHTCAAKVTFVTSTFDFHFLVETSGSLNVML